MIGRRALGAGLIGAAAGTRGAAAHHRRAARPVDLLLVLAADVSPSISLEELTLQRQGYAEALPHPAVTSAIGSGPEAAIGVVYFEWSGLFHREQVLPWRRIASAEDAARWRQALLRAPMPPRTDGTSIVDALDYARYVMAEAPWQAEKRVIDISGDGVDNNEERRAIAPVRARVLDAGITVNALAIEGDPAVQEALGPGATLAEYFRREVIGGPGSFVIQAEGMRDFARALRRKLVQEIAGRAVSFG